MALINKKSSKSVETEKPSSLPIAFGLKPKKKLAMGGFPSPSPSHEMSAPDSEASEHYDSIASAIMAKRKKMAQGGEATAEDSSSDDAGLKENYDDTELTDVTYGDDDSSSDDDHADMISKIRAKMKSSKGM